jgi:hypothetical protein
MIEYTLTILQQIPGIGVTYGFESGIVQIIVEGELATLGNLNAGTSRRHGLGSSLLHAGVCWAIEASATEMGGNLHGGEDALMFYQSRRISVIRGELHGTLTQVRDACWEALQRHHVQYFIR